MKSCIDWSFFYRRRHWHPEIVHDSKLNRVLNLLDLTCLGLNYFFLILNKYNLLLI